MLIKDIASNAQDKRAKVAFLQRDILMRSELCLSSDSNGHNGRRQRTFIPSRSDVAIKASAALSSARYCSKGTS